MGMDLDVPPHFLSLPAAARFLGWADDTLRARLSDGRIRPDAFAEIGSAKPPMPLFRVETVERLRLTRESPRPVHRLPSL